MSMSEENKLSRRVDNNAGISKQLNPVSSIEAMIKMLEGAEKLAEYVINSKTFGTAFETKVNVLDENGKPKLDKDGDPIKESVKNKADVISAIVLGAELGIEPMAAITLGRRLNADAYMKVRKGRELGLDPVSSLGVISIIETQNGPTIHTGVHVIAKVLIDNKIRFNFIKDFDPVIKYIDIDTKQEVDYEENKDKLFIYTNGVGSKDLTKAIQAGKIVVKKQIVDAVTQCIFKREGFDDLTITYTLQQAIDAGLYKGVTTDGEEVKGKANWNNHPATMLRNRTLTVGGRIIAGDKLNGIYSNEEASEFTDYQYVHEEENDAKIYQPEE